MIFKKSTKKNLIKNSYENFPLWSSIYLRKFMPDFASIYFFCRTVDDISDLKKDIAILKLKETEKLLLRCYEDKCDNNDIFFDLYKTIKKYDIPQKNFQDLIKSNYQDLNINRYNTFEDLISYCNLSANPVGRIVLKIFNESNSSNIKFSDEICTGLQIVNFIQDVKRDSKMNRIYIPKNDLVNFGVNEDDIFKGKSSKEFRNMIKFQCDRAEEILENGKPLVNQISGTKKIPISIFIQSGKLVIKKIRSIDYETITTRPFVSQFDKSIIITKTLINFLLGRKLI